MAIDSRNKRESALQVASPSVWVFPSPDNDLANVADRQHMAKAYSGISAGAITETILDYERGLGRGLFRGVAVGMN